MPGKHRRRHINVRGLFAAGLSGLAVLTLGYIILRPAPDLPAPHPQAEVTAVLVGTDPTPTRSYRVPRATRERKLPLPRHVALYRDPVRSARTPAASPAPSLTYSAAPRSPRPAGVNPKRFAVIAAAKTQLGDPYVWGGTGPDGWDCSGILQWAFAQAGLTIPRVSADQARIGTPTSVANLKPGDLIAWDGHIALWLGNNQLLESQRPGTVVSIRTFGTQGWWDEEARGIALDYSQL